MKAVFKSQQKKLLLITLITIFSLLNVTTSKKKCKIEKVDKEKIPRVSLYTETELINNFRNLQGTNWQPIRIYVDYTHLDSQKASNAVSADLYNNVKSVMVNTVLLYETLLLINPSTTKLTIPGCNGLTIDPNAQSVGIDTDVIVIPFINIEAGADVEASASFCVQESTTGRPIAGSVGFGTALDFTKTNAKYYYSLLVLHEMNHILCFHSDLFPDYLDSTTGQRYTKSVVSTLTVNGESRQLIVSPKVVAAVKKHYNCPNAIGAELENQGGDGTAGSHWEERTMLGEYMIGESYDEVVISEMTMALFEDSGWYKANYYTGGLFRYGKDEGCDFLDTKCVNNGVTKFPNEFAVVSGKGMCFAGRTGKGVSSLQMYGSALPADYQYWTSTSEGGMELADYCPVAGSTLVDGFWYASSCSMGKSSYPAGLNEVIGGNAYCFYSSLSDSNSGSYKGVTRVICHSITCDSSSRTYTITVGTGTATCPKEGGAVSVTGMDGAIVCPDYNMLCTKSVPCSDPIDCVLKKSIANDNALDFTPVPPTQDVTGATAASGSSSSGSSGSSGSSSSGSTGSSSGGGITDPLTGGTISNPFSGVSNLFGNSTTNADANIGGQDGTGNSTTCVSFFGLGCNGHFITTPLKLLAIAMLMILF